MSSWRYIVRTLLHHWRINLAVALGVSAATAVLSGALLVGDSVRGSLRYLTLDRLGRIDEVLVSDRFFRSALAGELAADPKFKQHYVSAAPVIIFPTGTVERKSNGDVQRASRILVIGCDRRFWELGRMEARPQRLPGSDEIILNEPLADDLGIDRADLEKGDGVRVTLRIPTDPNVPADFSVGMKEGLIEGVTDLRVIDIVPAESLGRFSIHPSQQQPRNAYTDVDLLRQQLRESKVAPRLDDEPAIANAIFVAGKGSEPPNEQASQDLDSALQPTFADCGFALQRVRRVWPESSSGDEAVVYDYFSFSTERMILSDQAAAVAEKAFADLDAQPVFTYVANYIGKQPLQEDGRPNPEDIRWSTISAIHFTDHFQPVSAATGKPIQPLAGDEIVLNEWAANDLQVNVGDQIYVTYFDAETSHGVEQAKTEKFQLADIANFAERPGRLRRGQPPPPFAERPTVVNDPDLTPYVPGVTDAESVESWNLPYNTHDARDEDDDYYSRYGLTPKAFVALGKGRELWGSRFGSTTTFRIPKAEGVTENSLRMKFLEQARRDGVKFGFDFIPIKRNSLQASAGATPFDVLFLFLSFFIIAAALMLVALLFRLGVEQRANEVGILLATGFPRRKTSRILAAEGLVVASFGGLLGIGIGIAYAWVMIYGLNHWWSGAIVTSFLRFQIGWLSLVIGYAGGVAICVLTIVWTIWRTRKVAVRQLLAGQASQAAAVTHKRRPWVYLIVIVLLAGAVGLAGYATKLGGESQAGAFVGAGFVMLSALLLFVWYQLRQGGRATALASGAALARLSARNAGRNPWRSTITVGLVGFASFLIVAMSSFRLAPTETGVAGFDLIARSSRPIFHNLNTEAGRQKLLATDVEGDVLKGGRVLSFRVKPGQDASCNNLYQATQPRVLGVTEQTIKYFANPNVTHFSWASSAVETDEEKANPWQVLAKKTPPGEPVPVVIDKNTAMYSLKLYFGIGEEFEVQYDQQTKVTFRVAGLLSNSVLQGSLMIGEADFQRLFPHVSGYQFFLIRSPAGKQDEVVKALERRLGDQGFDAESSKAELAGLLAVQNTYLETFQSLGALGLLLGTLGLATVQLRSVLERRQELALMRAAGFRRSRLATMVMLENSLLLFGGLMTGVIAALLAVLPHMIFGDATVPWRDLAIMLGLVLVVGFLSGFAAVRWTLKAPLLAALRGE